MIANRWSLHFSYQPSWLYQRRHSVLPDGISRVTTQALSLGASCYFTRYLSLSASASLSSGADIESGAWAAHLAGVSLFPYVTWYFAESFYLNVGVGAGYGWQWPASVPGQGFSYSGTLGLGARL